MRLIVREGAEESKEFEAAAAGLFGLIIVSLGFGGTRGICMSGIYISNRLDCSCTGEISI